MQFSSDYAILLIVHKPFYASGFLYHLKTQQILLHQPSSRNDSSSLWSMFGGMSNNGENAQDVFTRIMYRLVKLQLLAKHIYPVYDYYFHARNKIHYVFYALIKDMRELPISTSDTMSWFTFKQTSKLLFDDQTKQDIVVSERVINAAARENESIMPSHPVQRSNLFH